MKQLLPAIIAAICIIAGGAGGYVLKNMPKAEATTADAEGGHGEEADSHSKPAADKGGHGEKSSGHGGKGDDTSSSDVTFYKFSREFVVPMIANERVNSLVILNINLEVDSSTSQSLFSMEPKLRDNMMTTLIRLSSEERVFNTFTDVESYELIRSSLLANLRKIVPEGIHNVLILDMARQDL